jgi:hypothetical protein
VHERDSHAILSSACTHEARGRPHLLRARAVGLRPRSPRRDARLPHARAHAPRTEPGSRAPQGCEPSRRRCGHVTDGHVPYVQGRRPLAQRGGQVAATPPTPRLGAPARPRGHTKLPHADVIEQGRSPGRAAWLGSLARVGSRGDRCGSRTSQRSCSHVTRRSDT